MINRLVKLREERSKGDQGFTLIELLVVVVIIGILIAIAIPLYLNYRKGANDKAAESDLRGAVSTLELCQSDNSTYPTGISLNTAKTGYTAAGCTGQTIEISSGTTLTYFPDTTTATLDQSYIIESTSSSGSGKVYCYASAAGGSVAEASTTVVTAYAKTCPAA